MQDYGPESNRGYRYVLVVVGKFSKFGWTVSLKKAQSIKNSFENFLLSLKRKPNLIESDRRKKLCSNVFQNILKNNNIKYYSRNTYLRAVFAERFNRTITNLLKKLVLEKGHGNWVDALPIIVKQYNKRIHSSTKLTPIQAGLEKNEGFAYNILSDKRKRIEPKIQVEVLLRTVDLNKTFSKSDTTNWSHNSYKITEIINDALPSYHIDNLKGRYNESLLKNDRVNDERKQRCYESLKFQLN